MVEAARPELAVAEWRRAVDPRNVMHIDRLHVARLKNIGRGPALHVAVSSATHKGQLARVMIAQNIIPILGPGDESQFDAELWLEWGAKQGSTLRFAILNLEIVCWDLRGYRHTTRYQLTILDIACAASMRELEMHDSISRSQSNTDCMNVVRRVTVSTPVWRLNLRKRLSRVPVLRRWVRSDDGVFVA